MSTELGTKGLLGAMGKGHMPQAPLHLPEVSLDRKTGSHERANSKVLLLNVLADKSKGKANHGGLRECEPQPGLYTYRVVTRGRLLVSGPVSLYVH